MAFAYDHDCPFEVFITNLGKYNEGNLVGEWVKFPTKEEELKKVFERIGIEPGAPDEYGGHYEEWFITDYDCYVPGLTEAAQLGEYENLDELNYLASKLMELDDCEQFLIRIPVPGCLHIRISWIRQLRKSVETFM